jgi:pimeloyl-ACP methyl ester carboxylesterase
MIAATVHELIGRLGLTRPTLVGHDVGGMVAFRYLKQHLGLRAAVIMDTVVPGVRPWHQVISNPYVWHFGFHSIPDLPERLVRHDTRAYFDYFIDGVGHFAAGGTRRGLGRDTRAPADSRLTVAGAS